MKKIAALILALIMVLSLTACGGGTTPASSQAAQTTQAEDNYPTKALINIVTTSAGGSTDIFARLLGTYVEKYLGQTWVVENHTGGASIIGTTDLANSAADGYTVGVVWSASIGMRPYLMEASYTIDDFEFLCGVLHQYNSIIVRKDAKWQTLDDLLNDLKTDSSIKYGAGAAASMQFVWMRYIMDQVGAAATYIPHDGDAGAITSLQSGAVDFVSCETTSAVSGLKSGEFRMLVNCGTERDPSYPDVPCLAELGYKSELSHTMSIAVPDGVPADRVKKLQDAIKKALEDPDMQAKCKEAGYNAEYMDPQVILTEIENLKTNVLKMKEQGLFDQK